MYADYVAQIPADQKPIDFLNSTVSPICADLRDEVRVDLWPISS
jgi:hypothetical protein